MANMHPAASPATVVDVSDELRATALGKAIYILGLPSPLKVTLTEMPPLRLRQGVRYHVRGVGVDGYVLVEVGQNGAYIARFAAAPPAVP